MSDLVRGPAPRPCESCPYRRDVPSGVWADEEYDKLPEFDKDTASQPPGVFLCHQQNGRVCAGWIGCHGAHELLGVRIAASMRKMSDADLLATLNYTSPVPLFASGAEAAAHGKAEIRSLGTGARRVIAKVSRRQKAVRRG